MPIWLPNPPPLESTAQTPVIMRPVPPRARAAKYDLRRSLTVLSRLPNMVPIAGMTALFLSSIPLMVMGENRLCNPVLSLILLFIKPFT